jgi:hypothetical protein
MTEEHPGVATRELWLGGRQVRVLPRHPPAP